MTENAWYSARISNYKWIPVKYGLPKECGYYIVYIHEPDELKDQPEKFFTDEKGDRIDSGFVYMAYFNIKQGGIWLTGENEVYGGDLDKIDTNTDYYISHWQQLPDRPIIEGA